MDPTNKPDTPVPTGPDNTILSPQIVNPTQPQQLPPQPVATGVNTLNAVSLPPADRASVVVGILALIFSLLFAPIGFALGITAIIKGKTNRVNRVLGIIATVISSIILGLIVLFVLILRSAPNDVPFPAQSDSNSSAQSNSATISDTEASAAKSFFTYVAAKNYATIYNKLTESSFKQQTTEAKLASGLSDPTLTTCSSLLIASASYPYNVVNNKDGGQTLYYKVAKSAATSTTQTIRTVISI
jgi:uncharacterized membrane protein